MEITKGCVEAIHVIGHQVDHLTHTRFGKGFLAQFEALSIDERTSSDPHLHAEVVEAKIVEMGDENKKSRAEDYTCGV